MGLASLRRRPNSGLFFLLLIIGWSSFSLLPISIHAQSNIITFLDDDDDDSTIIYDIEYDNDYECDYYGTTCPEFFLFNDMCESDFGDSVSNFCWQSDCFDCDPCKEYYMDCNACVKNGCYWCPSEASCLSQPLSADTFWDFYASKTSSCTQEDDWQTTCPLPENRSSNQDPLYEAQQWVYDLIQVEPVWWQHNITGRGVMVRVNDPDGVDATIADLKEKFVEEASCANNYYQSDMTDLTNKNHGTVVAAIALAAANNSICSHGIAPDAMLSACIGPRAPTDAEPARFFLNGLETTDVSINSWGFDACQYLPGLLSGGPGDDESATKQQQQQSELQLLWRCPFRRDDIFSPCLQDFCVTGPQNNQQCQESVQLYCQLNYVKDPIACAEYLDLFLSCHYNVLSDVGRNAITRGIQEGRNGKGIIYVIAAGNEFGKAEDVNMEGWLNTRFTIAVGAVNKNGYHASYSTPGAALFVSAPGGDFDQLTNHVVAQPGGGCGQAGPGTSVAAPVVGGVVALMLEANPELTWRDVQGILASTSQRLYPNDESWATNGAGVSHSYKFGFGIVHAQAAVEASKSWKPWGSELQILADSGEVRIAIPDNGPSEGSTIEITQQTVMEATGTSDTVVESVAIYVKLEHPSRGDLKVVLLSPSGTESILTPGKRPENTQVPSDEQWKFLTLRNWNENPVGTWILFVDDEKPGVVSNCIDLEWQHETDIETGLPVNLTCTLLSQFLNSTTECEDDLGPIAAATYEGNTPLAACCACGGGKEVSSIDNVLVSWSLVLYGHERLSSDSAGSTESNKPVVEFDCGDSCIEGEQFCGRDNKCYFYDCINWFIYGPAEFTGLQSDNQGTINLVCDDYAAENEDTAIAAVFGCSAFVPGSGSFDRETHWPLFFDRRCTASPRGDQTFECFDLSPEADFDNYLSQVFRLSPDSCETNDPLDLPRFWYNLLVEQVIDNDIVMNISSFSASPSFNSTKASNTMFSRLSTTVATCELGEEDSCGFETLFNAECDACAGDCFDCDQCRQAYSYDYEGCVEAECAWCPGDATCFSEPLGEEFWLLYEGRKVSSCPRESDWIQAYDNSLETNVYGDPLYDSMSWAYELINVEAVWKSGITGKGVHVRVNDDGVDFTHPEFKDRFDILHSCREFRPADPEIDTHGTACASIIAGAADNDACAVGIAHDATVSACVLPNTPDIDAEVNMFLSSLDKVDISSNSWGPRICQSPFLGRFRSLQDDCPFVVDNVDSPCSTCESAGYSSEGCELAVAAYCIAQYEDDPIACAEALDIFVSTCSFHFLSPESHEAFVKTIQEGRNGKGVIYVFAAGNDYFLGVNANNDGYINSRFTIAVGGVGKDGLHASYSTTGAAVFVAAPGGDFEHVSNNIVAKPGGGCHDITVGTSFAAPMLAGVVALMLEVNPSLSWRDVQGVLAVASQKVDPADSSWVTNAAGFNHSYKYGFGLVDASAAVNVSRTWQNLGSEKQATGASGKISLKIKDDSSTPVVSTINITASQGPDFVVESVVAYLKVTHPSRGDLKIVLISPSGTESELAVGNRKESQQLDPDREEWKLMSLRNWGEDPNGAWTLRISDESKGVAQECLDFAWGFEVQQENEFILIESCQQFEQVLLYSGLSTINCENELIVPNSISSIVVEGRTILEACCFCGGGQPLDNVASTLLSWRLMVYGHEKTEDPANITTTNAAPSDDDSDTSTPDTASTNSNDTAEEDDREDESGSMKIRISGGLFTSFFSWVVFALTAT